MKSTFTSPLHSGRIVDQEDEGDSIKEEDENDIDFENPNKNKENDSKIKENKEKPSIFTFMDSPLSQPEESPVI